MGSGTDGGPPPSTAQVQSDATVAGLTYGALATLTGATLTTAATKVPAALQGIAQNQAQEAITADGLATEAQVALATQANSAAAAEAQAAAAAAQPSLLVDQFGVPLTQAAVTGETAYTGTVAAATGETVAASNVIGTAAGLEVGTVEVSAGALATGATIAAAASGVALTAATGYAAYKLNQALNTYVAAQPPAQANNTSGGATDAQVGAAADSLKGDDSRLQSIMQEGINAGNASEAKADVISSAEGEQSLLQSISSTASGSDAPVTTPPAVKPPDGGGSDGGQVGSSSNSDGGDGGS